MLPLRSLLIAAMINALRPNHAALLTRITITINSFSTSQRRALGIAEWDEQGSYHRDERLVLRVIEVLEGWA